MGLMGLPITIAFVPDVPNVPDVPAYRHKQGTGETTAPFFLEFFLLAHYKFLVRIENTVCLLFGKHILI